MVKRFRFTPVTNDAYARPQGASPLRIPLVPAYRECTEPNRVHGAPLEHGSCNPPGLTSSSLTVGTPDANGRAASSAGLVRYTVHAGVPGTPADEADVALDFRLSDVRNAGDLSDYTGELEARANVRITDRSNGESGSQTRHCAGPAVPGNGPVCRHVGGHHRRRLQPEHDTRRDLAGSRARGGPLDLAAGADRGARRRPRRGRRHPGNAVFARQGVFIP